SGWRGLRGVWPASLTAGIAFAIPQFLVSNYHGPWLVDVIAGITSILAVIVLLRFWTPKQNARVPVEASVPQVGVLADLCVSGAPEDTGLGVPRPVAPDVSAPKYSAKEILSSWLPWLIV